MVSNPAAVVTNAAYLLFYRRRSSEPLGGPRFKEIMAKFDNEDSDHDATESSEDGATGRSGKTAPSLLTGTDDDELLPGYGGNTVRRSIEDEGPGPHQRVGARSLDMTQAWSFSSLDRQPGMDAAEADYPSDDAQFDSSGDDGGQALSEKDAEMASTGPFEDNASWDNQDVMAVPADGTREGSLDEVAEIHLEGDRA